MGFAFGQVFALRYPAAMLLPETKLSPYHRFRALFELVCPSVNLAEANERPLDVHGDLQEA